MISKACVVGAYQSKLEQIAAHDDIDLTVVVPRFWREGRRRLVLERAHTRGYRLVVAPIAFNGRFHTHFYPTLGAILRDTRPDLVHMDEEPYNLATYLAVRAARRVGARAIFFTWQNLLRRYPWPFAALEEWVYSAAPGALAGSQTAQRVLEQKGYPGLVRAVPQFGVDPEAFRPAAAPDADDGPFRIGYAGRLVAEKGVAVLLQAVARLDGDWRLAMYGSGPLREALAAQAVDLGIAPKVEIHQRVASVEMPQKLRELDVLVLPSLTRPNWMEQFGRVLVEAMACGVPVVGSDSGEIPNVVGDAGIVVPEGDVEALANQLHGLQRDEGLRCDLARRGRERVLARFTQAQIARETVAVYREICAQR
jgi:glycosyltransferase involved in cell wall biosynthesis